MTELLVPELAQSDVSFRFYPFKRQNGSESFLRINLNINAYISETGGLRDPNQKAKLSLMSLWWIYIVVTEPQVIFAT